MGIRGQPMSDEDLQAEIERLRAENEALKRGPRGGGVTVKVSEKGGVSVYGLGRFSVTLCKEQWHMCLRQLQKHINIDTSYNTQSMPGLRVAC
jgi:hypothetical protein